MADQPLEILKGTLDLLVLRMLSDGPAHGYALAARLRQLTGDALRIEEGSLYPALYRMARKGWIESEWCVTENNQRAKLHSLTASGRRQLVEEERYWARFSRAVRDVLFGTAGPAEGEAGS